MGLSLFIFSDLPKTTSKKRPLKNDLSKATSQKHLSKTTSQRRPQNNDSRLTNHDSQITTTKKQYSHSQTQ